jgi:hypothetical protein
VFHNHFRLWVILIVEHTTVTLKCRTAIKALFLYFNLCPSVMLDSLSCSFTYISFLFPRGRRGRDRMVVGFTTTYAISAYHHWCEFKSRSGRGVLDTTLCDKVYQWLATGQWFSQGPPVSSTNKNYHHVITEILLKVAFNTIKPNLNLSF